MYGITALYGNNNGVKTHNGGNCTNYYRYTSTAGLVEGEKGEEGEDDREGRVADEERVV